MYFRHYNELACTVNGWPSTSNVTGYEYTKSIFLYAYKYYFLSAICLTAYVSRKEVLGQPFYYAGK